MTKQVEVITSVQRRRSWPRAEKEPIHVSQLFRWRQQLCTHGVGPGFAAVAVAAPSVPSGVIEVEFTTGARLRIGGPIDAATVSAAITALARSERRR